MDSSVNKAKQDPIAIETFYNLENMDLDQLTQDIMAMTIQDKALSVQEVQQSPENTHFVNSATYGHNLMYSSRDTKSYAENVILENVSEENRNSSPSHQFNRSSESPVDYAHKQMPDIDMSQSQKTSEFQGSLISESNYTEDNRFMDIS